MPSPGPTGRTSPRCARSSTLPDGFPPEVLAEAERGRGARPGAGPDRVDATDIELVTIDPPGSKDLDQARRRRPARGDGFRVHYAIADLGAVVAPGRRAGRRGAPPRADRLPARRLGAAAPAGAVRAAPRACCPDGPRAGRAVDDRPRRRGASRSSVDVRRAVVRSRARLDYAGVQADVDAGRLHPAIAALPEVGPAAPGAGACARGAIELELPEQEVVPDAGDGRLDGAGAAAALAVEDWNAEISLLTGMSAAGSCSTPGSGCCARCPHRTPSAVAALRRTAQRLGIDWPDGATAARGAGRAARRHAPPALALRRAATTLLRGAGLHRVRRAAGVAPPADPGHGGHRRAVRARHRAAAAAGGPLRHRGVPGASRRASSRADWLRAALPTLPELMAASDALAGKVERACVDRTEAALLAGRVGEAFEVVVLRSERPRRRARRGVPARPAGAGPVHRGAAGRARRCAVRLVEADPSPGASSSPSGRAAAGGERRAPDGRRPPRSGMGSLR